MSSFFGLQWLRDTCGAKSYELAVGVSVWLRFEVGECMMPCFTACCTEIAKVRLGMRVHIGMVLDNPFLLKHACMLRRLIRSHVRH